jgi:hypothetical protein
VLQGTTIINYHGGGVGSQGKEEAELEQSQGRKCMARRWLGRGEEGVCRANEEVDFAGQRAVLAQEQRSRSHDAARARERERVEHHTYPRRRQLQVEVY